MIFPFAVPPAYTVTVVGPSVRSASLGEDGTVVGVRLPQAFVWRNGKEIWHGDGYTSAAGPNLKGQVVLVQSTGLSIWKDGKIEKCKGASNLGMVPGSVPDTLLGITDAGKVVAVCHGLDSAFSVITWPADKSGAWPMFRPTALGPGGQLAGVTWGMLFHPRGQPTAFLQDRATRSPLGEADARNYPTAISRKGVIVGWRERGTRPEPVIFKADGATLLPVPGEEARGRPIAVNDRGEVVGWAGWTARTENSVHSQETVALWTGKGFTDLNAQVPDGWRLFNAFAVNDAGWILANGSQDNKPGQLVLLKPVADR